MRLHSSTDRPWNRLNLGLLIAVLFCVTLWAIAAELVRAFIFE
jgi:hypothetical protein